LIYKWKNGPQKWQQHLAAVSIFKADQTVPGVQEGATSLEAAATLAYST